VNNSIPAESMLFFNEKSGYMALDLYGEKHNDNDVFPIGIKFGDNVIDPKINHQSRKIISVGRITSFKTYNFKMVEIFDKILKIDPLFEYHIYGDGAQFSELEQFIKTKNMKNSIFLHSSLPYHDFEKVIKDAFIFVGSGTALLEAAAMGVPAVIGIESDTEGLTYGLLSKLPGYSYHEKALSFPLEDFVSCIKDIAALDASGYADISEKSKVRASDFSIEEFVDLYLSYLKSNALLPIRDIHLNMPRIFTRHRLLLCTRSL
jgi:glycosyltransferase involved in cell wall biosynthesis